MIDIIDGELFRTMIRYGAAAIQAEKQSINDLNVFPVPDGDTGTNMSLTIGAAVTALAGQEGRHRGRGGLGQRLRSAAGCPGQRSGVILSLLFRGIARELKEKQSWTAWTLPPPCPRACLPPMAAVMKPAEGTILTVARLAAERAAEASMENTAFQYVLEQTIDRGQEALRIR